MRQEQFKMERYKNSERIKSKTGVIKKIDHTPRGFMVTAEFEE